MPSSTSGSESNHVPPLSHEQIVAAVELELSAQRAQRPSVNGARTLLRLFGLFLLLALFAAGLGAMLYLQTVVVPQRPSRPAPPPVTSRAP